MGLLWAALLGLVEGITEFLPVSSTGHLIVVGHLLGFTGPKAETFEVAIQLGAIAAVVVLYWPLFWGLVRPSGRRRFAGVRGMLLLFLTTLPACVLGLLLHSTIKGLFFPLSVAAALAAGAVVMLAVESRAPRVRVWDVDAVSARDALWVGFWQCLALWPGFSRSAATIMGGMMLGFSRKVAAEYSFLAAVPVMVAATGYDLWKSREFLSLADLPLFGVGFVVAFVSACVAIRVFLHVVGSTSFRPFALYRLVVAAVVWGVWR